MRMFYKSKRHLLLKVTLRVVIVKVFIKEPRILKSAYFQKKNMCSLLLFTACLPPYTVGSVKKENMPMLFINVTPAFGKVAHKKKKGAG